MVIRSRWIAALLCAGLFSLAGAPAAFAQEKLPTGTVRYVGPDGLPTEGVYATFEVHSDFLRMFVAGDADNYIDVNLTDEEPILDPATGAVIGGRLHWTRYNKASGLPKPPDFMDHLEGQIALSHGTLTGSLTGLTAAGLVVDWVELEHSLDGQTFVPSDTTPMRLLFVPDQTP